ncbi:hypothetical protein BT96DRAFT_186058 [Gymnopus androsaceus JB14]|uniref:Uncharacterized protein n=1 Tax=Gymnopus androsaceus JB14 TaxID=1447944 RepID=A0A6A4H9R1_9AGAR|nr:hypothetical protein BT96DRAFT_186058 [Gymnopus androsaceus JB14]
MKTVSHSTMTELKEELRQFLLQPQPLPLPSSLEDPAGLPTYLEEEKNPLYVPSVPDPPIIPAHLGSLPPEDYIDQYPFSRDFLKYTPKRLTPSRYTPVPLWQSKARLYLRAGVTVDRSCLAPIADPSYNPAHEKQRFVHEFIFKQRWTLEELASQLMSLVELGVFFCESS